DHGETGRPASADRLSLWLAGDIRCIDFVKPQIINAPEPARGAIAQEAEPYGCLSIGLRQSNDHDFFAVQRIVVGVTNNVGDQGSADRRLKIDTVVGRMI